jgi:BirA family biotin operon repressor/biotin-[acetyl-CoA-carboxylase] ligase
MAMNICDELSQQHHEFSQTELNIICYDMLDSTQNMAKLLALKGAPSWTIIVAESQKSGRGRWGRKWISPRGGLWFTVILKMRLAVLSPVIALSAPIAAVKAIKDTAKVDVLIKWPNDIVTLDEHKVGGILIEGATGGHEYLTVGFGINVNNDIPHDLPVKATSLRELTGRIINRATLLKSIIKRFKEQINLIEQNRKDEIIAQAKTYMLTIGKRVRIIIDNREIEGEAIDLGTNGELIIHTEKDIIKILINEVRHVRTAE